MQSLAVGAAMGLVNAADNVNQSKVGTMQSLAVCTRPVVVVNLQKPLDSTQPYASHTNNPSTDGCITISGMDGMVWRG